VAFFKDSLHVLYYNQLKTKQWKGLDKKERGRITTCFRHKKKCVKYLLCFMVSFPSTPPRDEGYSDWLKAITAHAETAERKLLDYWNQKHGKNFDKLTFSMIENADLEDLDVRFINRPPDGIGPSDMEIFTKLAS
jgi:hypothetical protein